MSQRYDTVLFWNELLSLPPEKRTFALEYEKDNLIGFIQEDSNAFLMWQAFFSSIVKVNPEVFIWLLSLRPEVASMQCPFPILHEGRSFNGCTLFHLMLLIQPCHEYLNLLEDTVRLCDSDGNSSLFYSAFADNPTIYARVWKLLEADGWGFRRAGPQSAAVLVRAGWMHIKRNQIHVPQLIKALGGLKAAMNFAVQENSFPFANELLRQLRDVDWDDFVQILMKESFVHFKTFLESVDEAMAKQRDLKTTPQEIIRRAHALCEKYSHHRQFLKLVSSVKEHYALAESLDELVELTDCPYQLLYYVYKYPTCLNTVKKIASRCPPPPEVFDLRSKALGSYLHVVCKRIGSFDHFLKGCEWCCISLEVWYMAGLLRVTKDRHWTVVDAEGKKPADYLGETVYRLDNPYQNEIRRRTYSDRM